MTAQGYADGAALILLAPATGAWVRIAGTTLAIWDSLEYPVSEGAIAAGLIARYCGDKDEVVADVSACLAHFAALGLVECVSAEAGDPARARYLGLLKRAVSNFLYPELEAQIDYLQTGDAPLPRGARQRALRDIALTSPEPFARIMTAKRDGMGQGKYAHTISGLLRLTHIERCAERVFTDGVAGAFLEAGTCRGGAAIFLRGLQVAHNEAHRALWVVDSFAGVAPSITEQDHAFALDFEEANQPWLACDLPTVRSHFERYGLLDVSVRFLPGWIADTLPVAPIGSLALLRLDLDLYSATLDCLTMLYDRVTPGGFILVDDYGYLPCCRAAIDAFREHRSITEPIEHVDRIGSFWRKS